MQPSYMLRPTLLDHASPLIPLKVMRALVYFWYARLVGIYPPLGCYSFTWIFRHAHGSLLPTSVEEQPDVTRLTISF